MSWLRGESIQCEACGRMKKPRGRSASLEMANGLCNADDCAGYLAEPQPGDLWPGETREEFGYPKECPVCELPIGTTALIERLTAERDRAREIVRELLSRRTVYAIELAGVKKEIDSWTAK